MRSPERYCTLMSVVLYCACIEYALPERTSRLRRGVIGFFNLVFCNASRLSTIVFIQIWGGSVRHIGKSHSIKLGKWKTRNRMKCERV